jgi:DNA-binding transcriptional MocR family regulator
MTMIPMGTEAVAHAGERRREVRQHVLALIEGGALRRGSRLPSILELSRTLGVAKNTVIAALDELCGEGVLEGRERQGFFVKSARRRDAARATALRDLDTDHVAHGMASILAQTRDDMGNIGNGTTAESLLGTPEWTAFLKAAPPRDPRSSLRYADPAGEPRLREVIGARYGDADDAAERTLITHGAVEALNLAFAAVAARTGNKRVAIESPGYFMLGPILEALGLEPVAIPRTRDALDTDRLRREIRRAPIAAIMVNPSHHNPTGATLSLAERFDVARLAEEHRAFVVEDDVYRGLYADEEEPPSILSLLPSRTIYLSSFSKTLGPALRVGYLIAPAALMKDLLRRKYVASISGDAYTQNLVADFVDQRRHQRHLVELREELCRRARIARREAEASPSLGRFTGKYTGGLFHRFDFAEGIDPMALYRAAREENVLLSPGYFFRTTEGSASDDAWMRVNVSRCEPTVLGKVLKLLERFVRGGAAAPGAG